MLIYIGAGILCVAILLFIAVTVVFIRYYLLDDSDMAKSCLYIGTVKHSRLKGEAMHSFQYPLFFTLIDLSDVQDLGWKWWPIFRLNGGNSCFCSLENKHHLKGFRDCIETKETLGQSIRRFMEEKSQGALKDISRVSLLSHLTYFGYCFNPISIYYLYGKDQSLSVHPLLDHRVAPPLPSSSSPALQRVDAIVAEVSNTPWNEQHSYALHESVPGVKVDRPKGVSDGCDYRISSEKTIFKAEWNKQFHVSPFMEMDYKYSFTFGEPGNGLRVNSQMIKLSTNEVWFTASFLLKKIPFTPLNLLYVLAFYPLHTRMIQILIHWEAVKLFFKGVSVFNHPDDADVDFGFGITGKRLVKLIHAFFSPFRTSYTFFTSKFISKKKL